MKKVYVSWTDVQRQTQEVIRQMYLDKWRPDYVVGITRGGLTPANLISQYLDCPMYALQVRLRDGDDSECESNLWMAEDAFGYEPVELTATEAGMALIKAHGANAKNILIVDDINDSGATINWIRQDWQKSCLPNDSRWADVWGHNVRIATLYDNETSAAEIYVNYTAETVNKVDDPQWIVFPWEEWWKKWHPNEQHV